MIGLSVVSGDGIYICGAFSGILDVAGLTIASQGLYDGYVIKVLESDGSPFGCVTGGGVEDDVIFGTFGSENGIYFTGYLMNEATFGSTVLVSSGGRDVVIGMLKNIPVLPKYYLQRKLLYSQIRLIRKPP